MQNELGLGYDYFSVVDRPERPVNVLQYDPVNKVLRVPETNEKSEVMSSFFTYKYNGRVFKLVDKPGNDL